jgi:hypothetical protein
MADTWPGTAPARDAVERRCGGCHPAKQLPRHVTARIPLDAWGDLLSWVRPLSRYSRHRIYNLGRPEKSLILLAPLCREAGGYAEGKPKTVEFVQEDLRRPPRPVVHPVIFTDRNDPDYRKILAHIRAAGRKLDEIKRFDMPGFRCHPAYIREMKRYGVLPAGLSSDAPVDPYAADRAYWKSLWYRP